mmetsp:Transcript_7273/g.8783  ORF Transcript_7273/g.8783 Transcript_7273/m.8783 type:complete len:140 (+) Transcript_7273:767-1186(+)
MASSCYDELDVTEKELWDTYEALGKAVVSETEKIKNDKTNVFSIHYSPERSSIIVRFIDQDAAVEYVVKPVELRKGLSKTSEMLGMKTEDVPEDIHPVEIELKGKYAVGITWSDGHDASIYSREEIRKLCETLDSKAKT